MSVTDIVAGVGLLVLFSLLGIFANLVLINSFRKDMANNQEVEPQRGNTPNSPRPTIPMIEFLKPGAYEISHIDAKSLEKMGSIEPLLFQYLIRRTFLKKGLALPQHKSEQCTAIVKAIPQHELVIMVASLQEVIRYNCTFLGDESLSLFIDCSLSMQNPMQNGMTRFDWAKSIAIGLLCRVLRKKITVFLRTFSDNPHEMHSALNNVDFDNLMDIILAAKCDGWADVKKALMQALDDRSAKRKGYKRFHVVLITDSDEDECGDISGAAERFGADTFFHVISIGSTVPALEALAHNYRMYE